MGLLMSSVNGVETEYGVTELSDEKLVSIAKSGSANAFVELSKRHANKAFQVAYRITGNRHDAQDALQDSLLRAFLHMNDFEGRSSFSTWLTRIAITSALMILRKKRGCSEISFDGDDGHNGNFAAWEPKSTMEDPESSYVRREEQRLLWEAIHRLPPMMRDVVQLQQTKGCSTQEIAESLGITVSAVKSRMGRARKELRAFIAPYRSASRSTKAIDPRNSCSASVVNCSDHSDKRALGPFLLQEGTEDSIS